METDHLILREDVLRTVTVPEQEANLKYLEQKALEQAAAAGEHADAAAASQESAASAKVVAIDSATAAAQAKSDAAASATQAVAAKQIAEGARDTAVSGAGTATAKAADAAESAGTASGAAASALTDAEAAATQAAVAVASASSASANADAAASAKVVAESARDAALIQGGVYVDEPTGRAAVADGQAFKVQGSGDVAAFEYRRVNAGASTLIATYPSKSSIDSKIFSAPGADYALVEMDAAGRMSRYVDPAGRTFLVLHPSVTIPGALPTPNQFVSTDQYPFALLDSFKRLSELVIEDTGRFPKWVARALVARAQAALGGGDFGGAVQISEVYTDATQLANGAAVPMDTGQASSSFGIAPLYVSGGEVVHDTNRSDNNAGYLQVPLLGKASRIGAAYVFPPGAGGAITLVLPVSSWSASPGGTPAGVHLVLNYDGSWHCSYLNMSESIYASGNVGNQADGVRRFLEAFVSGNDVSIRLPDGSVVNVTDARVGTNVSNLAIFELYEFAAQNVRPRFHALWADSKAVSPARRDTRAMALQVANFINSESV